MMVTSPASEEANSVFALLAVITDPDKAKKRLEAMVEENKQHIDAVTAEKQTAVDAAAAAQASEDAAKQHREDATAKLAAATKLTDDFDRDHADRTAALDERNDSLLATSKRLTEWEAQIAAHEKEQTTTLTSREESVKEREADVTKREAALRVNEEATQQLKEAYQRKVDAFRAMQEELK